MSPDQIERVQSSFEGLKPFAPQVARVFYAHLFAAAPQLRSMFHGDMDEQGRKLMAVLSLAVAGLDDLPSLLPAVRALGARHVGYGVRPDHYGIVGTALLRTLEDGLGDAFTPDMRQAWALAYATLAGAMVQESHAAVA
ncbi:globin family protein [Mongoliimonas terrestris]|uniref:globin family protein n=1 Tax=Mongoliimonas terrestris TaxID=1709001 RepID=UPI000949A930|nr:globin family protein [Mongoliimonas terrestris]